MAKKKNLPKSRLSSSLTDVSIEYGRIINVHLDTHTVDFRSEFSERYSYDIPWSMPCFDQLSGTGITFIPEAGQTCFCVFPSDSEVKPFILAFMGAHEDGAYKCGKERGNPGDILINGPDGNFMAVRRGGIIQIGAKPICQTLYFPIKNIIQNISENYQIDTFAGDLIYEVLRKEDSSEGESKCIFGISVRQYANDKKEMIKLSMGALDDNNTFLLESRDKGGGNVKLSLSIDKDGNVKWKAESKIEFTTKGDFNIKSDAKINIEAKNDINIKTTSGAFSVDSTRGTVHAKGNLDVKSDANLNLDGAKVNLGKSAAFNVVRASPDLISFFATVATVCNTVTAGACTVPVAYTAPTVYA